MAATPPLCNYRVEPLGDGTFRHTCDGGRVRISQTENRYTFCTCHLRRKSELCVHRGAELGTVDCTTCQGTVRLKTFACPKHEQCTIAKAVKGVACCDTCVDFEERPAA